MRHYVVAWRFRVAASSVAKFEQHYGPKGTWSMLFRKSEGYLGTLLLKDEDDPLHYVTIDRWRSVEDYREFRVRFGREYSELDGHCEALTTEETALGEYTEIT